jgi:hypothetical protein
MTRSPAAFVALGAALAVALAAWSGAAAADQRETQVQAGVRRLLDATYQGDVDTAMRLTNPVVFEELGGRIAAKAKLKEAMGRLQKISLKIETFEFPEPTRFVEGEKRTYAVVPTRVVVSSGERQVDSRSFQVGIRPKKGGDWTYIEGPKFEALRAEHFPDFPSDFEYPEVSRLN